MARYVSFEELECWQKCCKVRLWTQAFIQKSIDPKDFDMVQNLRRAARSTTRNIAEEFGRFHYKENIQFCRISRGSLFEIKDDLITCLDEKKISEEEIEKGKKLVDNVIYSLNGYIKYLRS
ncbi:four helix bundle protein [Flagellimonas flava]|uniref:Four helix bundle protein n=1 Tax=Flagellimonas flava TaxID=570519 RepID=A0A1M5NAL3_9FLAO|nr:four helix bundle protein [Allomuricauda flava]SHG86584.1 four helix bundle protein [Allomuricauda flava]